MADAEAKARTMSLAGAGDGVEDTWELGTWGSDDFVHVSDLGHHHRSCRLC